MAEGNNDGNHKSQKSITIKDADQVQISDGDAVIINMESGAEPSNLPTVETRTGNHKPSGQQPKSEKNITVSAKSVQLCDETAVMYNLHNQPVHPSNNNMVGQSEPEISSDELETKYPYPVQVTDETIPKTSVDLGGPVLYHGSRAPSESTDNSIVETDEGGPPPMTPDQAQPTAQDKAGIPSTDLDRMGLKKFTSTEAGDLYICRCQFHPRYVQIADTCLYVALSITDDTVQYIRRMGCLTAELQSGKSLFSMKWESHEEERKKIKCGLKVQLKPQIMEILGKLKRELISTLAANFGEKVCEIIWHLFDKYGGNLENILSGSLELIILVKDINTKDRIYHPNSIREVKTFLEDLLITDKMKSMVKGQELGFEVTPVEYSHVQMTAESRRSAESVAAESSISEQEVTRTIFQQKMEKLLEKMLTEVQRSVATEVQKSVAMEMQRIVPTAVEKSVAVEMQRTVTTALERSVAIEVKRYVATEMQKSVSKEVEKFLPKEKPIFVPEELQRPEIMEVEKSPPVVPKPDVLKSSDMSGVKHKIQTTPVVSVSESGAGVEKLAFESQIESSFSSHTATRTKMKYEKPSQQYQVMGSSHGHRHVQKTTSLVENKGPLSLSENKGPLSLSKDSISKYDDNDDDEDDNNDEEDENDCGEEKLQKREDIARKHDLGTKHPAQRSFAKILLQSKSELRTSQRNDDRPLIEAVKTIKNSLDPKRLIEIENKIQKEPVKLDQALGLNTFLCLDVSQSMEGEAMEKLKSSVLTLTEEIEASTVDSCSLDEKVGVVLFGSEVTIKQPMTIEYDQLTDVFEGDIPCHGDKSSMLEAIITCILLLHPEGRDASFSTSKLRPISIGPRIILMTNGLTTEKGQTPDEATKAAFQALPIIMKASNVSNCNICCVQLPHGATAGNHDDEVLMKLTRETDGTFVRAEESEIHKLGRYFRRENAIGKVIDSCIQNEISDRPDVEKEIDEEFSAEKSNIQNPEEQKEITTMILNEWSRIKDEEKDSCGARRDDTFQFVDTPESFESFSDFEHIKVGDKVKLCKGYEHLDDLGKDIHGYVKNVNKKDSPFQVLVQWNNGKEDHYKVGQGYDEIEVIPQRQKTPGTPRQLSIGKESDLEPDCDLESEISARLPCAGVMITDSLLQGASAIDVTDDMSDTDHKMVWQWREKGQKWKSFSNSQISSIERAYRLRNKTCEIHGMDSQSSYCLDFEKEYCRDLSDDTSVQEIRRVEMTKEEFEKLQF